MKKFLIGLLILMFVFISSFITFADIISTNTSIPKIKFVDENNLKLLLGENPSQNKIYKIKSSVFQKWWDNITKDTQFNSFQNPFKFNYIMSWDETNNLITVRKHENKDITINKPQNEEFITIVDSQNVIIGTTLIAIPEAYCTIQLTQDLIQNK